MRALECWVAARGGRDRGRVARSARRKWVGVSGFPTGMFRRNRNDG